MKGRVVFTGLMVPVLLMVVLPSQWAMAQPLPAIDLNIQPTDDPAQVVTTVKLLVLLTMLSLIPAFVLMMTSFTRIVIVLSLLRSALGIQQTPPNQVIIGLSLFLTIFIMAPVFHQVNDEAIQPYLNNQVSQEEAWVLASDPLRNFMYKHTREKDLALFVHMSGMDQPSNVMEVPLSVFVPAFIISELKTAFQMGFLLYVPFLVIDMVVASTLMSMGMFMLPPVIISLPFKLLLFVMIDGWYLVVKSLMESFI